MKEYRLDAVLSILTLAIMFFGSLQIAINCLVY